MNTQPSVIPSPVKATGGRKPLLWAASAYAGGIFAGFYLWRPALWWLVAMLVLCASGCYLLRRRAHAAFGLGLLALFAMGALSIQVHASAPDTGVLRFANGEDVIVTAHVVKEGSPQEKFGGAQQKLDLETEQITSGNEAFPIRSGLRVGFYGKETRNESEEDAGNSSAPARVLHYGDRLRLLTKLTPPRNFRNPGAFDYQSYLAENGVVALGSAKTESVELLPGFAGNRAERWRIRIHRSVLQQIQRLWPAPEAALVDAMLMGENTFLGRELLTDFQRTGTYHVLVVSGLKVGILAMLTFWLLRRVRVRGSRINDLVASSITVLLVVAYALLTDVGTPVWRATLMLAVYLGARLLYRQRSILNAIGAAGLALLIVDPAALFGASFQLSFLCVLVIAGIGVPVLERSTQPIARALRNIAATGYDYALSPQLVQFRLDLRMIAGRLQRFLSSSPEKHIPLRVLAGTGRGLAFASEFLVISVILQAGFALPMAYYFHRATLVSLPANVLAVPLTEIIMVLAMLAVGISYASLTLAKVPALITKAAIKALTGSVAWFGGLRIADTRVPTPALPMILLGASALIMAMVVARRRAWLAAASLAAMTACALWITIGPSHPRFQAGVLELTTIDVGQGDSILLVSPQGRTLLVDAGGLPHWMHSDLDIGEDVVSSYLWSRGIQRLDAVALTHAHADHMGGMAAVLENFRPREFWLGVASPSPELQALLREAKQLGITVISHTAGDVLGLGGAMVRILAPPADMEMQGSRPNDQSLVMRIAYGQTSALLEGDAEKKTEKQVTDEDPQADLLKVAHHGSATSTIPELLAAVHPRFAVISVGARNVYGHPRWEVLNRLAESRVRTYRTDLDGAVTFYLDGKTVIPRSPEYR